MGDLYFLIKTLIGTFVVVVLLQIKIGEGTVERHVMGWIHQSEMTAPIQEAAHGGVIAIRELWKKIVSGVGTGFSKSFDRENLPGSRNLGVAVERSRAYLSEQAERAAELVKGELGDEMENQQGRDEPIEPMNEEATPQREWAD
ncbi:hypothetical protein OAQ84_01100 [Bdellovibrionales bacterium]|nr:hypothetical protein [Bdellovibrionales bacterium]